MKQQNAKASRGRGRPALPTDFASTLLASEFELEKHCTVENVNMLVGLYQQAIEFYEHRGDSRFVDYQARMHKMFLRADVQAQLNPASGGDSPGKPRAPKLRQDGQSPVEVPIKQTRKLEHLFDLHKKTSCSASTNAKRDVADMHSKLGQRLAQRKLNKSALDSSRTKGRQMNSTFDCELSSEHSDGEAVTFSFLEEMQKEEQRDAERRTKAANSLSTSDSSSSPLDCEKLKMTSSKPIDDLAKQIEEVMERIYTERANREAEIKVKYETQIAELLQEMNGSEFMRKIVDNMREQMRKDTEALWQEMEAQRKREIKLITEEYAG